METLVEEKIKWLEANAGASADDLKAAKKAVEDVAAPIFSKLYSQEGAGNAGSESAGNEGTESADEKDEL